MAEKNETTSRAKILQLPNIRLPHIDVAATSGQGNKIEGSRTDIWLCPAYGSDYQQLTLYVKVDLSHRAIMVEVLAAQLAQAVGLNTPDPYIVTVKPSHVRQQGTRNLIAFGTLDVATRTMARPVRSLDQLFDLLENLKIADLACAFDEWIANDVRHPNDILICPESSLYLIDHEGAMSNGIEPDVAISNWLASQLLVGLTDAERAVLLRRLRSRLAAFHRVEFEQAPQACGFLQDGMGIYKELVSFLIARLLSERIIPEQLYLKPLPSSQSKGQAGKA
jgi:hypothetical protein